MNKPDQNCKSLIPRWPQAIAKLKGSKDYLDLHGTVRFYTTNNGTLVYADVQGLPHSANTCSQQVFGFHIHGGGSCSGNADDPFADVGTHFDKNSCPHPSHSGDLPPLFGNNGIALSVFLTNKFTVEDVIDKAIIIHASPDDFTTQPSGSAGKKIACGIIKRS